MSINTIKRLGSCDQASQGPVSPFGLFNGAEVFALLVHCREFQKPRGYNTIIEGDSLSTI